MAGFILPDSRRSEPLRDVAVIRSMTGYGRAEAANARLGLAVEVKSVNHRHLDVALKLPRAIAGLEQDARRLVQSAVQRGRVDVAVSLVPVEGRTLNPLTVDLVLAREYVATARRAGRRDQPGRRGDRGLAARAAGRDLARGRAGRSPPTRRGRCWSRR